MSTRCGPWTESFSDLQEFRLLILPLIKRYFVIFLYYDELSIVLIEKLHNFHQAGRFGFQ